MVTIRLEKPADAAAREALLDLAYGPVRFDKPSERLRAGRGAGARACPLSRSRTAASSAPCGCGRCRPDRPVAALLLGPLAVDPAAAPPRHRLGADAARAPRRGRRGHRAVLLVGDAAYYGRFGFSAERTGRLWLPGLAEPDRLLGCELAAGALDGVRGAIRAPKRPVRTPLVAAIGRLASQAA